MVDIQICLLVNRLTFELQLGVFHVFLETNVDEEIARNIVFQIELVSQLVLQLKVFNSFLREVVHDDVQDGVVVAE